MRVVAPEAAPPTKLVIWERAIWRYGSGGAAAGWCSGIACECAPGPQGRLNRPSSTISLVVGRRRRLIDGLSIGQTDSYTAKRGGVTSTQGMTVPETGNSLLTLLYSL
jgi:hypothetical protein